MNILMMTNTFTPHVGGVARSIERFAERYRYLGHHVKVVAPEYDNAPEHEADIVRIPAIRHFNHTDFSVVMPIPHILRSVVDDFEPDIIHSHHPFLVGGTALRIAHTHQLPIVFTHHTKYEDYTHNVPGDSPALKRFVQNLASNYANACDRVFAPSESIAKLIKQRGVVAPVSVVPTGIDADLFGSGDGMKIRQQLDIPQNAFVVGHLGRLSEEKNIPFLTEAIISFLETTSPDLNACFAVFGEGPLSASVEELFRKRGMSERLYKLGIIEKNLLPDAYQAMNVFAFSSLSETQGMVLTEAMAAGVPVVAVDAPGVREVVRDGLNGRLLTECNPEDFVHALNWITNRLPDEYDELVVGARKTAREFSMKNMANRALELYSRLRVYDVAHRHIDYPIWVDALNVFESEWLILKNTLKAATDSLVE